jgi:hypothetical protein
MEFTLTTQVLNNLNIALKEALGKPGALSDSHEVVTNQQTTFTEINIEANDYWYWQNGGRGITKEGNEPALLRPKIDEWVKKLPDWYGADKKDGTKGKKLTKDEQAFLITRKIHRDGYKGNFYADKTCPLFQDAIDKAILQDIQNYFNSEFDK